MTTGRDSSFMIKNISFTKQVHFYICKIQIRPKLYPFSHNRNTVHHYYHIADTASVAPTHTKLNLFSMVSFKQTADLQFKVKFAENCSQFNFQQMPKNFYSSYEQVRRNSERLLKWKLCPLYLSDRWVYLLRTQCASISGRQEVCKMYRCMIKIFWGGRDGDTTKTPSPYEQLLPIPTPILRCFWKDPLMTPTPTTPLQAPFTATPSPSTTPPS